MQLALEARPDLIPLIQPFTDFDWVDANEAIRNKDYLAFFKKSIDRVKIVSGFAGNEVKPVSTSELLKIYNEVGATYVVAPTVISYDECVAKLGKEKVFGTLYGRTFSEALSRLQSYGNLVAIPYSVCSESGEPPLVMSLRRALIICNIPPDKLIHLMGFLSLNEFYWYHSHLNVVSINTGIPILLGLQEKQILEPLENKSEPTYELMRNLKLTQKGWTAICQNIALLRRYML